MNDVRLCDADVHGEFLHAGRGDRRVEAKTDESFSGHVFCFSSVESDVFCWTSTAATERFNITEMSAAICLQTQNLIKSIEKKWRFL